jgi:hypothetical protein
MHDKKSVGGLTNILPSHNGIQRTVVTSTNQDSANTAQRQEQHTTQHFQDMTTMKVNHDSIDTQRPLAHVSTTLAFPMHSNRSPESTHNPLHYDFLHLPQARLNPLRPRPDNTTRLTL